MGGSSKSQTVGYRTHLGMHMVLCSGPIDDIKRISVDKKDIATGVFLDEQVTVDKPQLFGGDKQQGGISGKLDIQLGYPTQLPNTYLQSVLGTDIPAYRGVVSVILRQMYLGLGQYLKPFSFKATRTQVRQNGIEQWYPEKASITFDKEEIESLQTQLFATSSGWNYFQTTHSDVTPYQLESFDDSIWDQDGQMPFADKNNHPTLVALGWPNTFNTAWTQRTVMWLRKTFTIGTPISFRMRIAIDNSATIWVNGKEIFSGGTVSSNGYVVPSNVLREGENLIAIRAVDSEGIVSPGNFAYVSVDVPGPEQIDENPAHIIRECLTDPDWGMGYQEVDIDDDQFEAAADTLFEEKMGISLLWNREVAIEKLISEITKHIDAAVFVDRYSGKFTLKLIRDDYDTNDLISLDESNIASVESLTKPSFGELTNSVTAQYWNHLTSENASVSVQNTALVLGQGAVINSTIQYPGFTNGILAARAAHRDLKTLSTSLWNVTLVCGEIAKELTIGSVFKFSWEKAGISNIVMRITGLAYGDGKSHQIRIQAIQDKFEIVDQSLTAQPTEVDGWQPPNTDAAPITNSLLVETSYYDLVVQLGSQIDTQLAAENDLGYLSAFGGRPSLSEGTINADLLVDNGAGFVSSDTLDFCPSLQLSEDITKTQQTISVTNVQDIELIEIGTLCQIGNEQARVDAISEIEITLGRGVNDTVPEEHVSGTVVLFLEGFAGSDEVEYIASDSVDVKLLTQTAADVLSQEEAPTDNLVFASRAIRPYPPGNLTFNTEYFPETVSGGAEIELLWAHRDRLQQTSGVFSDFEDGDIGPEVGTTYIVSVYGENDELGSSNSGISDTFFDYTNAAEFSDFGYTGISSGDPEFSSVQVLLHFDGTDGDTTFTDEAGKTTWAVSSGGVVEIDSATGQFNESGLFTADGALIADTPGAITAGTGDFTVETFFRLEPGSASSDFKYLFYMEGSGTHIQAVFGNTGFGGRLVVGVGAIATLTTVYSTSHLQSDFDDGVWRHLAIVRESGNVSIYIDGALQTVRNNNFTGAAVTSFANADDISPTLFKLGFETPSGFGGNMDEFRFSAVSRYSGPFTPSNSAFSDGSSGGGIPRLSGRLRITVSSQRDGYDSYTEHDHTIMREGYGFNYGYFYGGT